MNKKKSQTESHRFSGNIQDTKVYIILSQFSVYELNRLKKFVASPYFNRNEDLVRMLAILDTHLRQKKEHSLSKSDFWEELYGATKFSDLKFRKLCSDLLNVTEQFLAQEIFSENTLQQADNLLVAVYKRKLEALYNSSLSSAQRLSDQYHFRPASYYYYEYSFQRNYYNISGLELARSKVANIEQIAANLDMFYVAEKLRSYITMIDRQSMATHTYQLLFMDEIFSHVEKGNLKEITPINLYFQIYKTRKDPQNSQSFEELKEMMEEHLSALPQLEAFEILDSALNYCISRINKGETIYLREYMDLSLMGIKNEVLLVNGSLSPWIFRNIVVTGLRLQDFAWVESFIAEYQHHIEEQYRENAVSFNLANLYFYEKKFSDVMDLLQEVEYDDPSYNRNSKIMLLFTYYELGESESLVSLLASFETYLRRNRDMPEKRKTPYLNLIKFLRSLVKIGTTDANALAKLKKNVEAAESLVNKEWLLEKIDELLEGKKPVAQEKKGGRKGQRQ